MKLMDFKIGTIFDTCTGQRWRCTDVGSRSILAIELKPDLEESWFKGPPYAVEEIPFDEKDIDRAYRTIEEAVERSLQKSAHPNFPHEAVMAMTRARFTESTRAYPHKRLWRSDRVADNGEILHPYGAEQDGETWYILAYELFAQTFHKVPDYAFVRLRHSTEKDLRKRREQMKTV